MISHILPRQIFNHIKSIRIAEMISNVLSWQIFNKIKSMRTAEMISIYYHGKDLNILNQNEQLKWFPIYCQGKYLTKSSQCEQLKWFSIYWHGKYLTISSQCEQLKWFSMYCHGNIIFNIITFHTNVLRPDWLREHHVHTLGQYWRQFHWYCCPTLEMSCKICATATSLFLSWGRDPQGIKNLFTFCEIVEHQSEYELQLPVVTYWLIQ